MRPLTINPEVAKCKGSIMSKSRKNHFLGVVAEQQVTEQQVTGDVIETIEDVIETNESDKVAGDVVETMSAKESCKGKSSVELIESFGSISKAIRGLDALKFSRGEIATMLQKRYQHVRNVLITPLTGKSTVDAE